MSAAVPAPTPVRKVADWRGRAFRVLAVGGVVAALFPIALFFYVIEPAFLSGRNVRAILNVASFDGIIVIGQTILLVAGEFDLSTWHVLPPEGTVQGLKAAVGEDIPNAGFNAAVAIGEKLGGKGTVAVTQGASNDTENTMSDAFRNTMAEKFPDIKVLAVEMDGFDPSAAEAKAVAILQGNPDVTAAFGTTGNSIQTWSGAAHNTGRDVTIIGMGYIRQNLGLVKSGAACGLVAQPLYEESAMVAVFLGDLAQGKTVTYMSPLPAPVVTAAGLEPYYKILESAGQ